MDNKINGGIPIVTTLSCKNFILITLSVAYLFMSCGTTPESSPQGCILGSWEGRIITEAINVELELKINALASGNGGTWRFVGANNQILNEGFLQAWQNGDLVYVIIAEEGAQMGSALSGGTLDNCNRIKGTYITSTGPAGSFDVTRQ